MTSPMTRMRIEENFSIISVSEDNLFSFHRSSTDSKHNEIPRNYYDVIGYFTAIGFTFPPLWSNGTDFRFVVRQLIAVILRRTAMNRLTTNTTWFNSVPSDYYSTIYLFLTPLHQH